MKAWNGSTLPLSLIHICFGFPRLGVAGAAVATVIGTMVALGMSVLSVMHPEGFLHLQFQRARFRLEKSTLATIANIGSSSLAEQLFLRFGFLTYTMIVALLVTTAFAAHQVGMNVITISFAIGEDVYKRQAHLGQIHTKSSFLGYC